MNGITIPILAVLTQEKKAISRTSDYTNHHHEYLKQSSYCFLWKRWGWIQKLITHLLLPANYTFDKT